MQRQLFVAVGVIAAVVGCSASTGGIDRDAYVAKNVRLLDSLPVLPGARPVRTESSPYTKTDTPGADVVGVATTRTYMLPPRLRPPMAIDAYVRLLTARRWKVVNQSGAPSVSARQRDAYVHILAAPREVFVEVDHDCYKGLSTPQCFGP